MQTIETERIFRCFKMIAGGAKIPCGGENLRFSDNKLCFENVTSKKNAPVGVLKISVLSLRHILAPLSAVKVYITKYLTHILRLAPIRIEEIC
jgi:hypothetical protein